MFRVTIIGQHAIPELLCDECGEVMDKEGVAVWANSPGEQTPSILCKDCSGAANAGPKDFFATMEIGPFIDSLKFNSDLGQYVNLAYAATGGVIP